jgi:hypothetical protein
MRAARTRRSTLLAVLLLAMLAAAWWTWRELARDTRGSAASASLAIEQFSGADSQAIRWSAETFADSLAARLAAVEGLSTRVISANASADGFSLNGDFRVSDGRLVLSTRLMHSGEDIPVWSGTFWRSENSLGNFVDDVAAGVAQALYADIARRALTTRKERS